MSVRHAIERQLAKGPQTVEQLAEATDRSEATIRNALSPMYFEEGTVGCDPRNRFHLLTGPGLSNGVPVIRHQNGEDIFA